MRTGSGPLCSNACLLARALERTENHTPVFPDGQSVLAGLTVEEIGALARPVGPAAPPIRSWTGCEPNGVGGTKKKLRGAPA